MATIKPNDIPLDKIDQVIERLQALQTERTNAKVAAGEAVKVNVVVVEGQDIEAAKARAVEGRDSKDVEYVFDAPKSALA